MKMVQSIVSMAAFLGVCLLVMPINAFAQDYTYVKLDILAESPQLHWAKGIVFRDVLVEKPGERSVSIDDREVYRFKTEGLGDVYADQDALDKFETLKVGRDYYFSGTIAQKKRKYYYVVNNVSAYKNDADYLKSLLTQLNSENRTNQYNQVFLVLEQVIQDVHNDIFGYSTTENIPISQVVGDPAYRTQVASAVRAALRRFENASKGSSEELFISTIVSMMALQYGYADTTDPDAYQPGGTPEAVLHEESIPEAGEDASGYEGISENEWDLSEEMVAAALDVEVPEAMAEEVDVTVEEAAEDMPTGVSIESGDDMQVIDEEVTASEAILEQSEPVAEEDVEVSVIEEAEPEVIEETLAENEENNLTIEEAAVEIEEVEPLDSEDSVIEEAIEAEEVDAMESIEESAGITEEMVIEALDSEQEEIIETAVETEDVVEIEEPAVKDSLPESEKKASPVQEKIDYSSPLPLR